MIMFLCNNTGVRWRGGLRYVSLKNIRGARDRRLSYFYPPSASRSAFLDGKPALMILS